MIRFTEENGALIAHSRNETIRIEGWGNNALRVRTTLLKKLPQDAHALTENVAHSAKVTIAEGGETAEIVNGKIKATVNGVGIICFYKDNELILQEYYSYYYGSIRKEAICYKIRSREYKGLASDDFKITVRFESDPKEKLFGMGQYQMPILDLKGSVLPLEQRNSQVSVPFVVSNKGYGMLWNNPSTGEAAFGTNITKWISDESDMVDYWITADDTPAQIVTNYTECVGRAPVMSKDYLGLWQCKLRYRTPDEVLEVARKYKELGIKLAVSIAFYLGFAVGVWKIGILFLLVSGILWFYSSTYKKYFLTGNLLVGILASLIPISAIVYEIPLLNMAYAELLIETGTNFLYMFDWVFGFAWFIFLNTLMYEINKDIYTVEGDRENGNHTIPVKLGIRAAEGIITALAGVAMISAVLAYFVEFSASLAILIYIIFALLLPYGIYIISILSGKRKRRFQLWLIRLIMVLCLGVSVFLRHFFLLIFAD